MEKPTSSAAPPASTSSWPRPRRCPRASRSPNSTARNKEPTMRITRLALPALLGFFVGACAKGPEKQPPPAQHGQKAPNAEAQEAEIKEALAKLSPEDRKLAEIQRFCVVQTEE